MADRQQLIERMAADLKPARPLTLRQMVAVWALIALMIGSYYLHSVGARPDLLSKLTEVDYIFGLLLYLEAFILASWLTLRSVTPGRQPRHPIRQTLVLAISSIAAVSFYAGVEEWTWSSLTTFDGFAALGCCLRISFGALLPATVLMILSQMMAPLRPKLTAGYLWFAAAILVSIVSQLNCPVDGLSHVLIGHGILLGATGVVGWVVFWTTSKLISVWVYRQRTRSLRGGD